MDEVRQIISRVPAWEGVKEVQIERIAGLTNTNYRITVNGEHFVLRLSGQNTERLGINRSHEHTALQAAAAAGIGPEVVAFLHRRATWSRAGLMDTTGKRVNTGLLNTFAC